MYTYVCMSMFVCRRNHTQEDPFPSPDPYLDHALQIPVGQVSDQARFCLS